MARSPLNRTGFLPVVQIVAARGDRSMKPQKVKFFFKLETFLHIQVLTLKRVVILISSA